MQINIIRHLQTDWNRQGKLQGSHDIDILPIDDLLQQQIDTQKQTLLDCEPYDFILVSDLKRTQQTSVAYGYHDYTVEPLINELNFGQFEGRPRQALIDSVGQMWFDDPRQVILGESIENLHHRICHFLQKYQTCQRILIFAHGSWSRAMLSFVKYGDLRNMNQVQVLNNQLLSFSYQPPDLHELSDEKQVYL